MPVAILGFALFLGGLIIFGQRTELPSIRLDDGAELKVLKISVGSKSYEPWLALPKALAGHFIPTRWKGTLGIKHETARTLKVDLAKVDPVNELYLRPDFRAITIRFPDGRFAHASVATTKSNTVHLLFPSFPRTEKELEIQLRASEQRVTFKIPNPHRTRPEPWTHSALPQTNRIGKTAVVLSEHAEDDDLFVLLNSYGLGEDKQKWMQWRLELHDPTGNWAPIDLRGKRIGQPSSPLVGESLKLIAQGTEYISAGMVSLPEPQSARPLRPELRAVELGLKKIYFLGQGGYEFEGESVKSMAARTNQGALLRFKEDNAAITVHSPGPSLLIFYEPSNVKIKTRLRERQGKNRDGKVFPSRKPIFATNHFSRNVVAGLFPISVKTNEQKLEAEIMVTHPAVEFFIAAEYFGSEKRK